MSTTTEGATGTKRRRVDGVTTNGRTTERSTPATAPPKEPHDDDDLSSLLGTRLEPLRDVLALQPKELQGTIISASSEMLDLLATIKQREKSYARFSKPMVHPKSQKIMTDEAGKELPFIPTFLRKPHPIKSSDTMNDEPRMKVLLEAAAKDYAEYQVKMTARANECSKLEISIRRDQFRKKFYDLIHIMALSHVVVAKIEGDGFPSGMKLTQEELASKITFDTLYDLTFEQSKAIGLDNGEQVSGEFANQRSHNDESIESKWATQDEEFMKPIIENFDTWIPKITTDLWSYHKAKYKKREVNAALRELLQPIKMTKANEDVDDAMDTVDATRAPSSLTNVIRKETQLAVSKEVQRVKRTLAKNCSGDRKTQPSTPTANGRKSRNDSATSPKPLKKKSKQKSGGGTTSNPKSALKKGKAVKFKKHHNQQRSPRSTEKDASRGGRKGGAGGKGADRR